MPRLISPAAYITPHMPAKPHSSLAALPAPPLATDAKRHSQRRSRAGRNGKNAPYQNLRKRCEGSSAELSDMRRRGSSHARRSTPRGEEVVFNRRSIATRNAAQAARAASGARLRRNLARADRHGTDAPQATIENTITLAKPRRSQCLSHYDPLSNLKNVKTPAANFIPRLASRPRRASPTRRCGTRQASWL